MSALAYPPLHKDAKFVVFSDWDATITNFDSNDYLTDNVGFGYEKRRASNKRVLLGNMTFRDSFKEMLDSVHLPFDECKELLKKNIKLDSGFKAFFEWCKANDVPFIIVSSGMAPLIRAVLSNLIGEEDAAQIDIISNDVRFDADGSWHIVYRHPDSGFGHDKSQAILPYRDLPHRPTLFFFGDGVSDMSAAKHADVLFAKNDKPEGENDLAEYCKKEGIPHILFRTFADALPIVKDVVEGRKSAEQALAIRNAEQPAA
ncbi:putative phosphatase YNL010W [Saccharomyces cerevisiae S288c] [Rhizoctonia solani]|uniref:Putative phosphatase YNL010W [Saccharomyces cerevisiae S288c] n=1 Tax=Rhizoctonia solani TaxID=456999 RepID=A0A0K6GGV2_9AGAM|nr:putative phosphatase YNL010W [Saccharomyces cerevisiae S288c] [Rhizoctonia solani]